MLKDHEKFWAFMALGFAVVLLAVLSISFPPSNDGTQRVIDAAMGGLTLALGAATNALFRIKEASEYEKPQSVRVDNTPADPVPATFAGATPKDDGELPESEKIA